MSPYSIGVLATHQVVARHHQTKTAPSGMYDIFSPWMQPESDIDSIKRRGFVLHSSNSVENTLIAVVMREAPVVNAGSPWRS